VGTGLFLIHTQSAGVAYFALGGTLCTRVAKLLKLILRQPRPLGSHHKPSYGYVNAISQLVTVCLHDVTSQHAQHAFRCRLLLRYLYRSSLLIPPLPPFNQEARIRGGRGRSTLRSPRSSASRHPDSIDHGAIPCVAWSSYCCSSSSGMGGWHTLCVGLVSALDCWGLEYYRAKGRTVVPRNHPLRMPPAS
jgi:hypothetical protein